MGQKVHPYGFRVGITKPWRSRWIANKQAYGRNLVEDQKVKKFIREKLRKHGLAQVVIERSGDEMTVILHTSMPGKVIGRGGEAVEKLRGDIAALVTSGYKVNLKIHEIQNPELDAKCVSESVAEQLERRGSFRRAMKRALDATMEAGALGVKIKVSGRLGGAEIARSETANAGSLPMHTLYADIDYGLTEARTTYGVIGVKVWIYRKSLLAEDEEKRS